MGNEHGGETTDPFQNAALFYLRSYSIILMEFSSASNGTILALLTNASNDE